jgi:hypothetical protein
MRMTKPQTAECILTGLRQQILCFCAVRSATATYTSFTQALYAPGLLKCVTTQRIGTADNAPNSVSISMPGAKSRAEQSTFSQLERSLPSNVAGRILRILHVRLSGLQMENLAATNIRSCSFQPEEGICGSQQESVALQRSIRQWTAPATQQFLRRIVASCNDRIRMHACTTNGTFSTLFRSRPLRTWYIFSQSAAS